jgi:hypothetical protein
MMDEPIKKIEESQKWFKLRLYLLLSLFAWCISKFCNDIKKYCPFKKKLFRLNEVEENLRENELRMGYWDESQISEETSNRTPFNEFVVKFIVAFSGSTLFVLINLM